MSPPIIRKQPDYWTLILGPKGSRKERGQISLSRFYVIARHQPDPDHRPDNKLEVAYHKADRAIQQIVDLVAAA